MTTLYILVAVSFRDININTHNDMLAGLSVKGEWHIYISVSSTIATPGRQCLDQSTIV